MRFCHKLAVASASITLLLAVKPVPTPAATFSTGSKFNFSYSGFGFKASGVLTVGSFDSNSGGYLITGISGTRNSIGIASLLPPNSGGMTNDNLLFASSYPQLDGRGFSYATADGNSFNVFYPGGEPYEEFDSKLRGIRSIQAFSATPTAIPEPSTWLGTAAVVGLMLLKKRNAPSQKAKL